MQYDMHYYGTYAMAAAAGIPKADAEIIATASQFVDDQNHTSWVFAQSQEGFLGIATAHHPLEAAGRSCFGSSESNDTRLVWVPFHFMPGGIGSTFEERLVCVENSTIVNKVFEHYVSPSVIRNHRPHALHLIGIWAHVFADTFSHQGFSGIKSRFNRIDNDSIDIDPRQKDSLGEHIEETLSHFTSLFSETAELGHGAVATYPDRPYLKWSFLYEDTPPVSAQHDPDYPYRDNPAIFLRACEALHDRFTRFATAYYGRNARPLMTWPQLKQPVGNILRTPAHADGRVQIWKQAMTHGDLRALDVCRDYSHQPWTEAIAAFAGCADAAQFVQSDPYKFFVAADYHRNFVLKRLLPSAGIGLLVA